MSKAIFFDFHGFKKQPPYGEYDVILGTANRRTVKSEVDLVLAEKLKSFGYKVFCPQEKRMVGNQLDCYDAGFTTRNVFLRTGVDSVQIEIHASIRVSKKKSYKFAEDFSKIIS